MTTVSMRRVDTTGGEINYALRRSKRHTLAISVLPDGRVEAIAPLHASSEAVDLKVRKRARWIAKQRRFFTQFEPRLAPRRYVASETHLYLGRQYRLQLRVGKDAVALGRTHLVVHTKTPSNKRKVQALLDGWYAERALAKSKARLDVLFGPFARRGCGRPVLSVRKLKRRWGSLSKNGRLTLNMVLIQAPAPCVDYVIVHELCHLVHADHGSRFYQLLTRVMPDWQKRRLRLECTLATERS